MLPEQTLRENKIIDFVCRHEFDYTCKELAEGRPWNEILGLSWRDEDGELQRTEDRELIDDWDAMPSVLPDLRRESGHHQVFHRLPAAPVRLVVHRPRLPREMHVLPLAADHRRPQVSHKVAGGGRPRDGEAKAIWGDKVREYMFDDDTFTINEARAIEISKHMKRLKLSWSCNARAHVNYDTLKALRDNGLRLLLVGFESGNQEILNRIKKGIKLDMAREFMANCKKLGIKVHGTFIIGLPVETPETVRETIEFAKELDPHTIQVSIASPYPGTELYDQALANGWFAREDLVSGSGIQTSTLQLRTLSTAEIEDAVERMYREFYFRPKIYARMVAEMLTDRQMMVRRLREGGEFFCYLRERKEQVRQRILTRRRRRHNVHARSGLDWVRNRDDRLRIFESGRSRLDGPGR